jgi:putative ABC transport system substrate-binding protein
MKPNLKPGRMWGSRWHLPILLCGAMSLPLPAWSATEGAASAVTNAVVKRVMFITNRGCEEICQSFQRSLTALGPVNFIMRDVDDDASKVAAIVAEARATRPDLVATWGTAVTLAAVGRIDAIDHSPYLEDIPVVYVNVGNPVLSGIVHDLQHSGRLNVAGANTAVPVEAQINLLNSYRKLTHVGMLYDTAEVAAVAQAGQARKAFEARGIQVTEVRLAPDSEGRIDASKIPDAMAQLAASHPDFLYQVSSAFTLQNMNAISADATARGIPMFTTIDRVYRQGNILLALTSPLAGIGQISAYQAGEILFHAKRPGDLPTPTSNRHSVLINMRAAHALKLYPPMKLLQFADISE